jgi:hypothetical protein
VVPLWKSKDAVREGGKMEILVSRVLGLRIQDLVVQMHCSFWSLTRHFDEEEESMIRPSALKKGW